MLQLGQALKWAGCASKACKGADRCLKNFINIIKIKISEINNGVRPPDLFKIYQV